MIAMHKWIRWVGILQIAAFGLYAAIAYSIWQNPFYGIGMPLFILFMAEGLGMVILSILFILKMEQQKIKDGEPAVGLVTSAMQTGVYINEQPQLHFKLLVTRKGGAQYTTELKAVISLLSLDNFKAGAVVPLLVSQQDRNKVAFAWEGQVATSDIQALMNEQLIKQDVSAELLEVSRSGEHAYAKVLDATPLGSTPNDKLKLRLDLAITKADGDTFQVTTTKEIRDSMLARLQPGTIIKVTYAPSDPSKIVLALPAEAADLKQTFGF